MIVPVRVALGHHRSGRWRGSELCSLSFAAYYIPIQSGS
uniref:Uncharacterized protein n=1 Tax=Arundo donax TaxID=35708 RepID=A0A0A9AD59_ARUDO